MAPLGYVVQQHSVRLDRPVKAYDKWINRIPEEYATSVLDERSGPFPKSPESDSHCLATLKTSAASSQWRRRCASQFPPHFC